jgi:hypothetical protein
MLAGFGYMTGYNGSFNFPKPGKKQYVNFIKQDFCKFFLPQ